MKVCRSVPGIVLVAFVFAVAAVGSSRGWTGEKDGSVTERQWPNFRGPLRTGVAPRADPPVEWSEGKNVRWKIELPGLGHSSPVVWDDRIFLTSALPVGDPLPEPRYSGRPGAHNNLPISRKQRFLVLAYDRTDGDLLWRAVVHEQLPHEGGHETGSYASASPVTDGERVYAFFGSYGLYCLDAFDGEVIWEKAFGDQFTLHGHGEGASPALWGDALFVNWDHEEESFVAAFDKRTGRERWRVPRDEGTSWSTPIVVEHDGNAEGNGNAQLVVSATGAVRGYDVETGTELWRASGLSSNVVASPVAGEGLVYALSSYTFRSGLVIRLDGASGDLDGGDRIAWRIRDRTPYIPSPLLHDGMLYFLAHYQGVLSRVEGETGEEPTGPFRLGPLREVYASPVAAAGRIYLVDRGGVTLVISTDPEPRELAENRLDDRFSATPALVDDELFLRGERFLYALREE
ncbi:MAG: PQQ-binding-like beta-propeller repeat protein [Verrucomicrobiales bacterium]